MLDDLSRLPFEMVLTESFGFVDRQQTLDKMNLALRRMRAADDEAISLRRDLVTAKDDVAAGRSAFGEHHLTVMVKAPSLTELAGAAADVQSAFTELGVIAVREDVNLEPALLGPVPRQLPRHRPPCADQQRQLRRHGQPAQLPRRQARGQPLGPGDHRAGDHQRRSLLL
jgi:type IV secretory pathway VirB4 component